MPQPRSNQLQQPRFDNRYPRAGTEACPYEGNAANPNGYLSDDSFIVQKPAFMRCVVECGVGVPQGVPKVAFRLDSNQASAGIGTPAEHPPRKPQPRSNQLSQLRFYNRYRKPPLRPAPTRMFRTRGSDTHLPCNNLQRRVT
jgi:hypothetical protein